MANVGTRIIIMIIIIIIVIIILVIVIIMMTTIITSARVSTPSATRVIIMAQPVATSMAIVELMDLPTIKTEALTTGARIWKVRGGVSRAALHTTIATRTSGMRLAALVPIDESLRALQTRPGLLKH